MGIIGVIAALTMPLLITNYRHKVLQAQFKKAYSVMSQLSQKFFYDNDITLSEYFYNTSGDYETFSASIKKYFNSFDKIEVEYNLKNLSGAIVNSYCSKFFTTNDGMILGINFTQSGLQGQDGPIVCIDINGFRVS